MPLDKKKKIGSSSGKQKVEVDHETIIVNLIENIGRGEVQLMCEEESERDFGDYFTRFVFNHYNLSCGTSSR